MFILTRRTPGLIRVFGLRSISTAVLWHRNRLNLIEATGITKRLGYSTYLSVFLGFIQADRSNHEQRLLTQLVM